MRFGLPVLAMLVTFGCASTPVAPSAPATDAGVSLAPGPSAELGSPAAGTLFRLPNDVHPTREHVALEVAPDQERFRGRVDISLVLDSPRDTLWVSARELTIRSGVLNREGQSIPVTAEVDEAKGAARLRLGRTVPAGPATLTLEFEAPFYPRVVGLYRVKASGSWAAYTQFEALDARRAFPCFDEPSFKIPWELELTVPASLQAFANTPQRDETPLPDGRKRIRFEPTRPLPSYLVAFAVGDFDVVTPPPLPPNEVRTRQLQLRGIAPKGRGPELAYSLKTGGELLVRLERWFGIPFPYEKLDHVAVPDFAFGAMENAGFITYVDWFLLIDDKRGSEDEKLTVAWVMAHEMAHQWFGDLVTMRFWDDKWLNESFASFMEPEVVGPWRPELGFDVDILERTHAAMRNDELETARPMRQPIRSENDINGTDDAVLYPKGTAVIAMFRTLLGADGFRAGIQRYLEAHEDGNATTDDLVSALSTSQDIGPAFRTFVEQSGLPRIEGRRVCDAAGARIALKQARALPLGSRAPADTLWQVPICARVEGRTAPVCTVLTSAEGTLPLPGGCPRWVHLNAGAQGYYRWLEPTDELDGLLGRGWKALSAPERLSAAEALLSAAQDGTVPASDVLDRLGPLVRDDEPAVVASAAGFLSRARRFWTSDQNRPQFEARMRTLLRPALDRIGWTARPGEPSRVTRFRPQLIKTLALDAHDPQVLARAAQLGRRWLGTDGRLHPEAVSPDLRDVAAAAAGRQGDAKLFETVLARLRASEDGHVRGALVGALASFQDPRLSERAREETLSPGMRVWDRYGLLFSQGVAPEQWKAEWQWTLAHQDALVTLLPENAARDLPAMQSSCSQEGSTALEGAFGAKARSVSGLDYQLRKSMEVTRVCAAVRAAQAPNVAAALTRRGGSARTSTAR
jgi:cytosol alanyl aminopeptidase